MTTGRYRKICLAFVCWVVSILFSATRMVAQEAPPGQFPFFKSFLDGDMTYVGLPEPNLPATYVVPFNPSGTVTVDRTNQARLVSGLSGNPLGLQLTNSVNQVGAFYLPQHTFSTKYGLVIEFEYIMMGDDSQITDGITMFLADAASSSNLLFGAEGAGLGYTYNWSLSSVNRIKGIPGGYLAVALDQGSFKTIRFEGGEQRNGIPYAAVGGGGSIPSRVVSETKTKTLDTRSNVTIRGAGGLETREILVSGDLFGTPYSTSYTLEAGYWGYPVLATQHTGWNPSTGLSGSLIKQASFRLNTADGTFKQDGSLDIEPFSIAGGGLFTNSDQPQYRKAIITLAPNEDGGGGFKVSVTIQHGNNKAEVIKEFTYPETITYLENGLPMHANASNYLLADVTTTAVQYTVPTPHELVVGFSASTGLNTAYTNIIKNLRITPLYAAKAEDDYYEHRRGPAIVKPLENDFAYKNDQGYVVESDKANVDPESFRFWKDENNLAGDFFEFVSEDGKWIYVKERQEVLFFPTRGFSGEASVFYDIIGQYDPFNEEMYRSSLAKITINIEDNQP